MLKENKFVHIFATLLVALSMISCAENEDDSVNNTWASTKTIYSASGKLSNKSVVNENGNIILVWVEEETEVRADTEKDTSHTFAGTPAAGDSHADIHNHMNLYSRPIFRAMNYDHSANSWSSANDIATGYWQKSKSGYLNKEDAGDNSKIIYDEKFDVFSGNFSVSVNASGSAVFAWIQQSESSNSTGDSGAGFELKYATFSSTNNTWGTPETITLANNTTLINEVASTIDTDGKFRLVWTARENAGDGTGAKKNLYSISYDGSAMSIATLLSDGANNVTNIKLTRRDASTGVVTWLQPYDDGTRIRMNLYSLWYSGDSWHSTPSIIGVNTSQINHYQVASNDNAAVWLAASQSDAIGESSSVMAMYEFSGDINSDLTLGSWGTATNIQAGGSLTGLSKASVSIDSSANVVVAWLESNTNIRANSYSKSDDTWKNSSFAVTSAKIQEDIVSMGNDVPSSFSDPVVEALSSDTFLIAWHNWQIGKNKSGEQIYSLEYQLSLDNLSKLRKVNTSLEPGLVSRKILSSQSEGQILWSATNSDMTEIFLSSP